MFTNYKGLFNIFIVFLLLIVLIVISLLTGLTRLSSEVQYSSFQNISKAPFCIENNLPIYAKFPRVVHIFWCNIFKNKANRDFTYKNYLSFRSAVVFLQPDRVIFHCNYIPNRHHDYHTWFNYIMEDYAWIEIKDDPEFKCTDLELKRQYISQQLQIHPGIFLGSDTIITGVGNDFWTNESYRSTFENDRNGYIVVPGKSIQGNSVKEHEKIEKGKTHSYCPVVQHLNNVTFQAIQPGHIRCVIIMENLHPRNIWQKNGEIYKILNFLMYQTPETPSPVPSSTALIPNIAHMLWLNSRITYIFYLSALSLLNVVKVDRLYLYTDGENGIVKGRGEYWEELTRDPKVTVVIIERPNYAFGNNVHTISHMSDVFRGDIMTKYGGIYSDSDVIWTQPIPEEIRRYDAVAALDWAHFITSFPEYLNLGVTLGKKESKFWKLFVLSLKDFRDNILGYNGLLLPYKIYERHPDSLYMYPSLQVMCFERDCHPLSGVNYTKLNFKKDTYAFHFTYPEPFKEFINKTTLLTSNHPFAEIGKYVLRKSGLL